jgi:hypothetical protein
MIKYILVAIALYNGNVDVVDVVAFDTKEECEVVAEGHKRLGDAYVTCRAVKVN